MMKYMCCVSQAISELIPLDIYKLLLDLDTFAGCIWANMPMHYAAIVKGCKNDFYMKKKNIFFLLLLKI